MRNKKIMIIGVPAAGKTTLMKLFDGHKNLRTVHTHEQILRFFYSLEQDKIKGIQKKFDAVHYNYLPKKKIIKLKISENFIIDYSVAMHRRILRDYCKHYVLEIWAELGILPSEASSTDYETEEFNFNFYDFDKEFLKNIFRNGPQIDAETYLDIYYDTYFKIWKDYNYDINNNYTVFFGPNDSRAIDYVLLNRFNIKIIYYSRDIISRLLSNSFRISRYNKNINVEQNFEKLVLQDIAQDKSKNKIRYFENNLKKIEEKYSFNVIRTDFENITHNTELEMKKICIALEIDFDKILLTPSLASKKVSNKYLYKSNDLEIAKNFKIFNFINFYQDPNLKYLNNLNNISIYLKFVFFKLYYFLRKIY